MADMTLKQTANRVPVALAAGERLQVRILNPDGTQRIIVLDDSVPVGKAFTGDVAYAGVAE